MSSQEQPLVQPCPNCGALLDVSELEPFSEVQCPGCDSAVRVRDEFDHFKLLELIASGGMGSVYKAQDKNLNRVVALKLLRKEFSADLEYIAKLEMEAKITASINHPNVVKVFSFGVDHGLYYIAMELVDKGSLDDLMELQGRVAELQVLEIGIQLAQGLRAALQAGLIHRDVKPGNILFGEAHTAKIVDFGLAMPLEQAKDDTQGEVWGTPYYVAPEKLNHEPEDFRSDIYSLGGTLFHALAGRPPFEAESASIVALKHLKSRKVSLQAFAPDVSSPTAYVINRTQEKSPDDRYQSYDELIEHLEYAKAQLLEKTGRPKQPKARVVMAGEDQQRAFGYLALGVLVAVLIGGGVLIHFKDTILNRFKTEEELQQERVVSIVTQTYQAAHQQLLHGDVKGALAKLRALEARPNLEQPLKNWVLVDDGIAEFLSDHPSDAIDAFNRLSAVGLYSSKPDDKELANFFPDVARQVVSENPVPLSVFKDFQADNYKPAGLFVFGLREWEAGRFEEASVFFGSFLTTTPRDQWKWVEDFKPLAQRYLDDYRAFSALKDQISAATTPEKKAAVLKQIAEVKAKLQPGKLPAQLASEELALQASLGENKK